MEVDKIRTGKKPGTRLWDRKNNCLEFAVHFKDGTYQMEPITSLVDPNKEEVNNKLIPFLCEYNSRCKMLPRHKRNCWFCANKAMVKCGLCETHTKEYSWLTNIIDNRGRCFYTPNEKQLNEKQ